MKAQMFVLFICFFVGSCSAQPQYIKAEITQIQHKSGDAIIQIEYKNISNSKIYFYKFNDCQDEVLFYDMLDVERVHARKKATYFGPIDYLRSDTQKDDFSVLDRGKKITCLINLNFFYEIEPSQNYDVSVKAFNPKVASQERFLIQSDKIRLLLSSSK